MLDDLPVVTTPRVFRGLSAKGLLVMEFVAGARATDAAFFRENDISAAKVSLAVLEAFAERGGRAASRDVRVAATSASPRRPLSRDVVAKSARPRVLSRGRRRRADAAARLRGMSTL